MLGRRLSRYYHHPDLMAGRAACRSREDVVRLLLGMTAPGRGSSSVSGQAASRKSSRSKGGGAAGAAAAAKDGSAGNEQGAAAPAGPGDGGKPQQRQEPVSDHHQQQQLKQLHVVPAPSSPRSPRQLVSSPRRVVSPRAAATFSPARHQPQAAMAQAAGPAGRPGRRRAAAAAAAAVQQAAASDMGDEEEEAAPVARSRGGRVLKRSAAAQVIALADAVPAEVLLEVAVIGRCED